jgi:cytochrome c oxidase subunit 2
VSLLVVGSIALAVWRRRSRSAALESPSLSAEEIPEITSDRKLQTLDPRAEKQRHRGIVVSIVLTVVALFTLLTESISTSNALESLDSGKQIRVEIVGRQWWWYVRYLDPQPANVFATANELRVPVGYNVRLQLSTADVIHSFWAPNLQGKRDLIPGRQNALTLRATKPGRYRSQCAEFCGGAHAQMAMWIVVESRSSFEAWRAQQRKSARPPQTDAEREGLAVFLSKQCATCHAIGGTDAQSHVGPDLTHFASRIGLAAASYPNRRGYLAGWLLVAQALKPHAQMPNLELEPAELHALLAYLESLQ